MTNEAQDHLGRPRVVVTGMGVKSPAGNDLDTFWSTLLAAESQAAPWTQVDPDRVPVKFGCEVKDLDAGAYLNSKEVRRQDRVALMAFMSAVDAAKQAGDLGADPARCGVVVGTGVGGLQTLEAQINLYQEKGADRVSPFLVPMMMTNASAGLISIQFGWTGPSLCVTTACAAGSNALGEGARLIRDGSADVVLAGGAECAITPTAISAFARMTALSTRNDDPKRASRPFDAGRDGFVMGEGAGFVVLETYERAVARGATILGEIAGYGRNCDAFHITSPSPGGAGAVACMTQALEDAGLEPSAISHVNAHGTSTPPNDAAESEACQKVFGGTTPPVTSSKGVTGHTIGAAGAIEAIATLLALRERTVPPVANYETPDPEISADIVHGSPRQVEGDAALSNSFGFGGHNASLVLRLPATA
ncbi:MAG: 3-oxoacyl-[acyl-carrier-protein] synthase, KASII [uncultured Acidimicrobiales bacterium]|uniref:3-oxoacyl-[acyl-carrier-protein] synthase 2 n=1 Tax=uncultured Acidimicrobiales bacterium TaxID=310071 RepID=A0A6J4I371_9ACTN|nr:MAG: 3-oxoacyl-[acyl-carrier-protein] synthase, KASII [uncultured Acidimicrobiales bacterium]